MIKNKKKLQLSRETLRSLGDPIDLKEVVGGSPLCCTCSCNPNCHPT
jgi:hypothetical protein